jgi:uncharacterized protein
MPEKPSSNEEEYFLRQEQEKLEKRRAEAAKKKAEEDRAARRELHYMHCPKCGGDLKEESYMSINVDRCTECHGVWFDAGEIESLVEKPESAAGQLLKDLGTLLGRKKKSS